MVTSDRGGLMSDFFPWEGGGGGSGGIKSFKNFFLNHVTEGQQRNGDSGRRVGGLRADKALR